MRSLFKVLILLIGLQACVEPFTPDISKYDDLLVVDAALTNEKPAATVKLNRSFPYTSDVSKPETNAMVVITDETGASFPLQEMTNGVYRSDASLVPVTGRHYQLHIVTSDGAEFESDEQQMLKAVPIDTISYSMVIEEPRVQASPQNGVNVFISSRVTDPSLSRYYKWVWEETWEIHPPFPYPGEQKICWQNQESIGIHIGTTENLVTNDLRDENLFFVPASASKLSVRYSVLIKQSALTRDNYIYLDKIRKINEGSGGFFDPIPGQLVGNIRKVGNPDYPVLGIFEASDVSEKRIFIDKSELKPLGFIPSGFDDCRSLTVPDSIYFDTNTYKEWIYLFQFYSSEVDDTLVFLVNYPKCYDCSFLGTKIRPDFWEDAPSAATSGK